MGSNPMQRMRRNSILLGLIIGLIVGLVIGVGGYWFLNNSGNSSLSGKGGVMSVCVLNKSVKSGEKVSQSDVIIKTISKDNVPSDAVTLSSEAIAKIDLTPGTILTSAMLNTTQSKLTDDLREQEYNMITLPTQLTKGDYVDIRLQLPNGGDFIVLSKKDVLNCNTSTIWMNMNEEEIDIMSSAIIEYYIMAGSKLYATKYTDPGLQVASTGTYVPSKTVTTLIQKNPNIKNLVNADRYSEALTDIRNKYINSTLSTYYSDNDGDGKTEALQNIEKSIEEETKTLKESREAYFGTLNSTK